VWQHRKAVWHFQTGFECVDFKTGEATLPETWQTAKAHEKNQIIF
jgi:hypothetical protein